MIKIKDIEAREILDSRGVPTVEVNLKLSDGQIVRSSVPAGTSKGRFEAQELRDNDGRGVKKAVASVQKKIAPKLHGAYLRDFREIDEILLLLDGTEQKSRLGANAILAVSLAVCRAQSVAEGVPLYQLIRKFSGVKSGQFPKPQAVMIEGGQHSSSNLDFQEFMIVSASKKIQKQISDIALVYDTIRKELKVAGKSTNVGLEGAYGPDFHSNREACDFLKHCVTESGLSWGKDILLALDCAANSYWNENDRKYHLGLEKVALETSQMISYLEEIISDYPIITIEDPLAEEDLEGWRSLTERLSHRVAIVGDDLLVTNPERIISGIENRVANATLIKPNQIGTVKEAMEAIIVAEEAGWKTIVSHRSGETNDDFIVDLAVACGCDFLKIGAPARGERVAKYNRLLEIEVLER